MHDPLEAARTTNQQQVLLQLLEDGEALWSDIWGADYGKIRLDTLTLALWQRAAERCRLPSPVLGRVDAPVQTRIDFT